MRLLSLTETDMMREALCGKVLDAACHFHIVQPSHSGDLCNIAKRIGIRTTESYAFLMTL